MIIANEWRRRIFSSVSLAILFFPAFLQADGTDPYRITHSTTRLPDSAVRKVNAEAHFPFPPNIIWNLLDKTSDYPQFIPRVLVSQSQGMLRSREQIYFVIDLPWPLSDLWNIISLGRDKEQHRFDWTLVDGNMKENAGSLRIEKEGESGSVVFFEVRVDPGISFPVGWIVTWGTQSYVPKMLRSIAKRLESKNPDHSKGSH